MTAPAELITSSTNQHIKRIRSLRHRHIRHAERVVVAEGWKLIRELFDSGITPQFILYRESDLPATLPAFPGAIVRTATDKVFDSLTTSVTPQGILAILPMPRFHLPLDTTPFCLVMDGLRDPGNLGTLVRSAAASGATAVIVSRNCVDPWNDKAIRAGMGAHWHVPILPAEDDAAIELLARCEIIAGSSAHGATPYDAVDWTRSAAIVIGGESSGLTSATTEIVNLEVSIPLCESVESLNAGVAGSIILFEVQRQRRNSLELAAKSFD